MNAVILVFILNLFYLSPALADDCKISGISNSPQTISCRFRDQWLTKMEGRIYCQNGKYYFGRFDLSGRMLDENHVTAAYHLDTARGPSILAFYVDEFGDTLKLRYVGRNRFKGSFNYGPKTPWKLTDYYRCHEVVNEKQ